MTDIEAAWARVLSATPDRWLVCQPAYEPHRLSPWSIYAYDTAERPKLGRRSREWTAVGQSKLKALEEMARCLAEIREGRAPK